jgi:hypothetical protein
MTTQRIACTGKRTRRLVSRGIRALVPPLLCVMILLPTTRGQTVASVAEIAQGSRLRALNNVPLINSVPRDGPLYRIGTQVGVIETNEVVTVMEVRLVRSPKGFQEKWIRVAQDRLEGWAYVGRVGQKSCCFGLVN